MDWLLKLDPNVVFPVVVGLATWVYRQIAGKKAKTVEQLVDGAVRAILAEVAAHVPSEVPINTWLSGARRYVEDRIWYALGRVGLHRSPQLERIMRAALERASSEIAARIAEERRQRAPSLPVARVVSEGASK